MDAGHAIGCPISWTVATSDKRPLGLHLVPTRAGGAWLVKRYDGSHFDDAPIIRSGMRLLEVNGIDPGPWSLATLVERLGRREAPLRLTFTPAPTSSTARRLRALSKQILHIAVDGPGPLGLSLVPRRHGRPAWLVKEVAAGQAPSVVQDRVRVGMTLFRVNGADPSSWSPQTLMARFEATRPLRLSFLPAPRSVTSQRLISMGRCVNVVLQGPQAALGLELVPRNRKTNGQPGGWLVKQNISGAYPQVRRGMLLKSVDDEDPTTWSMDRIRAELVEPF